MVWQLTYYDCMNDTKVLNAIAQDIKSVQQKLGNVERKLEDVEMKVGNVERKLEDVEVKVELVNKKVEESQKETISALTDLIESAYNLHESRIQRIEKQLKLTQPQ